MSEDISEEMSKDMSERIFEKIVEHLLEDVPEKILGDIFKKKKQIICEKSILDKNARRKIKQDCFKISQKIYSKIY